MDPLISPERVAEVNLSVAERQRYARHLTIPEVGIEGQKRLRSAKVLCIGAGGLGTIINEGITGTNSTKLIVGAIAVSLLAIIADYLFLYIQTLLTPKGLREVTS